MEVRAELCHCPVHLAQVGAQPSGELRRAHAEEVHVPEGGCFCHGRGEPQPAERHVALDQLGEIWLVERHLTLGEGRYLALVDIDTEYLEAALGHAGGVRRPEVPRADDCHA